MDFVQLGRTSGQCQSVLWPVGFACGHGPWVWPVAVWGF